MENFIFYAVLEQWLGNLYEAYPSECVKLQLFTINENIYEGSHFWNFLRVASWKMYMNCPLFYVIRDAPPKHFNIKNLMDLLTFL